MFRLLVLYPIFKSFTNLAVLVDYLYFHVLNATSLLLVPPCYHKNVALQASVVQKPSQCAVESEKRFPFGLKTNCDIRTFGGARLRNIILASIFLAFCLDHLTEILGKGFEVKSKLFFSTMNCVCVFFFFFFFVHPNCCCKKNGMS